MRRKNEKKRRRNYTQPGAAVNRSVVVSLFSFLSRHPAFSRGWFLAGSIYCSAVEESDNMRSHLLAWYLGSLLYAAQLI